MSHKSKESKPVAPSAMFKKVEYLGDGLEKLRAELLAVTPHKKRTDTFLEKAVYPRRKKIYSRRDTILDTGCENDCPACAIDNKYGSFLFELADLQRRTALEVARSTLKNQGSLLGARQKSAEARAKITPKSYGAAKERVQKDAERRGLPKFTNKMLYTELGVSREALRLYELKQKN